MTNINANAKQIFKKFFAYIFSFLLISLQLSPAAYANPTGEKVISGDVIAREHIHATAIQVPGVDVKLRLELG